MKILNKIVLFAIVFLVLFYIAGNNNITQAGACTNPPEPCSDTFAACSDCSPGLCGDPIFCCIRTMALNAGCCQPTANTYKSTNCGGGGDKKYIFNGGVKATNTGNRLYTPGADGINISCSGGGCAGTIGWSGGGFEGKAKERVNITLTLSNLPSGYNTCNVSVYDHELGERSPIQTGPCTYTHYMPFDNDNWRYTFDFEMIAPGLPTCTLNGPTNVTHNVSALYTLTGSDPNNNLNRVEMFRSPAGASPIWSSLLCTGNPSCSKNITFSCPTQKDYWVVGNAYKTSPSLWCTGNPWGVGGADGSCGAGCRRLVTCDPVPPPSPTGDIDCDPKPCIGNPGATTCDTYVTWSSQDAQDVEVKRNGNPWISGAYGNAIKDAIGQYGWSYRLEGTPLGGGAPIVLDTEICLATLIGFTDPWWQVDGGDIISLGSSILSSIPSGLDLILAGPSGYPGVAFVSSTGSISPVPPGLSGKDWNVKTDMNSQYSQYDYQHFRDLLPSDFATDDPLEADGFTIKQGTLSNCTAASDGYCYFEAIPTGTIKIERQQLGSKKVVLFAKGNVDIEGNINYVDGTGFFMIITSGYLNINSPPIGGAELEGIYFSEGYFRTSKTTYGDEQVHIRGVASTMDQFKLNRDLLGNNDSSPAEVFEFAPEVLLNFPRQLVKRNFNWIGEVNP